MGSYYVDDLLEVLSGAGIPFGLNATIAGWERRARSSGGFESRESILGIIVHHTASSASVESDLNYMVNGSPDKPVGNMLLDRNGIVWPIAAGAANTAGKGGPSTFSRGVCPLDSGNTRTWNIEAANNGVGEPWPQVQIDAYFQCIVALNAHFGNQPDDVITHAAYTTRKIDPATAAAVQGPWRPASSTSSGTWDMNDLRDECRRRANQQPDPPQEAPMTAPATTVDSTGDPWVVFLVTDGSLYAKHADDMPFSLGAPAGQTMTTDVSVVSGPAGQLYVWAYADDGSTWLKHWPGLGKDWDPWWHAG